MTASPTPPRRRLVRDLIAVFLGVLGIAAVVLAAAAIDWRLLLAVCGFLAVGLAVFLAQGADE